MALAAQTKELLSYLQKNPSIRAQIKSPPGKTLLYAGHFFRPVWKEIADMKRSNPQAADKEILPDVLGRIHLSGQRFATLLDWVKSIDPIAPWPQNGFIAWRAVSGIYASNATGPVSFMIGSGVAKSDKVFAATEIAVLTRNPNIDQVTRDMVEYYQRCVQTGNAAINTGYLAG